MIYTLLYSKEHKCLSAIGVTLLSLLVCTMVGAGKLIIGWFGHSHILIADGMHSLSDLFVEMLVLWAAKLGDVPPDENHPYGHKRVETLVTVMLSLMLIVVGGGIAYDGVWHVFNLQTVEPPASYTIWIALIAIVTNELLYRASILSAASLNSALLHTHAQHHRADVMVSVVVLLGIVSSRWGWPWIDPLGATVVGCYIIRIAWVLSWNGLQELVDTVGLSTEQTKQIHATILSVEGVHAVHCMRARSMAARVLVDVHVITSPHISVSEGHYIADNVRIKMMEHHKELIDVVIHIDSEDDEHETTALDLPSRSQILHILRQRCADDCIQLDFDATIIHYLYGAVTLELLVDMRHLGDIAIAVLEAELRNRLDDLSWLSTLRVKGYVTKLAEGS